MELYSFIILLTSSLPPVEPFALNIIAVPIPTIIPPYMHAKKLSAVIVFNLSNISIKIDKLIVPTTDLAKKDFPILYPENKNKGTFKTIFVIPIGILNK